MKMLSRSRVRLLAVCLVASTVASAQSIDTTNRPTPLRSGLTIGLNAGINQLYGDLSSPNIRPAFGLSIAYPLGQVVSVNLLGDVGTLSAQENSFYNSVAKTSYAQAAMGGAVNLTRLFQSKEQREQSLSRNALSFYLALGFISFNATAYSLTTNQIQRYTNGVGSHRTQTDGSTATGSAGVTSTHEVVVPIGLRYYRHLTTKLSLYGDLRYNFLKTDKLDASVDNDNTTINTLKGGDIFRNPASGDSRDTWASLSIGLSYQFGNR